VTPDANSFNIDTQIQTTHTGAVHSQPSLLNSGAMDPFIDMSYANKKHITIQTLTRPIPVYNVDGTPNKLGPICEIANIILQYHDHTEHTQFAVTCLGKSKMILGLQWLHQHNPEINWATNEVKMSHCPAQCRTCVHKLAEERKIFRAKSAKIQTCQMGPLTSLLDEDDMASYDEDSDLPGLSPDPDPEEDYNGESLKEGDCTFMVSIPAEAEFIRTSQTTSQRLSEALYKNTMPKSFHESVPTHVHDFKDVFSKASFDVLPM
jgi:hypothetical protein